MQADVVAYPNAVVIELVGASIARLAVLSILEHMSVAHVTVETESTCIELVLVKHLRLLRQL